VCVGGAGTVGANAATCNTSCGAAGQQCCQSTGGPGPGTGQCEQLSGLTCTANNVCN
jgi:hypothetical protein